MADGCWREMLIIGPLEGIAFSGWDGWLSNEQHPAAQNVVLQRGGFQGELCSEGLIEGKAASAQIGREALAFGLGRLARFVFRPAIKRGISENLRRALLLAWQPISRVAAQIIGMNGFGQGLILIMICVDSHLKRQPHADM